MNIIIKGPLESIKGLRLENTTLRWEAPYSLDLSNTELDIVYCVDVYNVSCSKKNLLTSDCNVTETNYTFDVTDPHAYQYEFTITPRSNVRGAVNGTPRTGIIATLCVLGIHNILEDIVM